MNGSVDAGVDLTKFEWAYIGVFFWSVTGVSPPDGTCDDSDKCAEPECRTPAVASDEPGKKRWCQTTACAYSGKDQPVDEAALAKRYPLRYELIGRRVHDRLARA